ncbi:hypothetical protein [Paraburkholderia antibiotica]|uniref:Uncharacterized protein n=1 Tax=Paraburkholderia antibiotica TaxID=2728839 RepID=A0A7Y0A137_9BURK|nr:hypothetical protein [Paraburkholderia antibiotica]NML34514.1 hypothetical protein [Paraburkholderia antibiotica]
MQLPIERVPLTQFMPFVMAAAQGLPETMAQAYVRQACIDFATRSSILRRRIVISLQPRVRAYPIWPHESEQVVRVNEVDVNGTPYRARRGGVAFHHFGTRFTVEDGMLVLSREPSHERPGAVHVRMCIAPSRDACEVDALLHDDWQQSIEDGALARIYQLPGYQFTSLQLAQVRGRSFDEGVARARIRALRSDTSASLDAIAPPIV